MATSVLIVDDAMFMRTVLKKMLIEEGLDVVGEGTNGDEAIKLAEHLQPDVITMDITMPERDGISAIEDVLKVSPKSKIIMCSAMGQQAMVIEAIQSGAKDFIVKPFQADRVLEAVNKAVG